MAKYEMNEIGEKIIKIRSECGKKCTQEVFGEMLKTDHKKEGYERKSISEWENNKKLPPIDAILKICEIGNVDIGYLVGDPDYRQGTITATRFQEETGLTEEAVKELKTFKYVGNSFCNNILDFISYLITSDKFSDLIRSVLDSIDWQTSSDQKKFYEDFLKGIPESSHPFFTFEKYDKMVKDYFKDALIQIVDSYIDKRVREAKQI